jgi:hypothetical protein
MKGKGTAMSKIKEFMYEEDGIAIVEIILILVLLVGLVLLFRNNITKLVEQIMDKITGDMKAINTP